MANDCKEQPLKILQLWRAEFSAGDVKHVRALPC